MSDVTLADRARMGVDADLRPRVAAALVALAAQVAGGGRPGGDADRPGMASWGYAMTVMAPTDEQVARAQWLIATLPDGPAEVYAADGADGVTDEALEGALRAVWAPLAGT